MADKRIQDLTPASSVQTSDRFVLEQSGQAKSLTGQILVNDLAAFLDGHGGISGISYTPPSSGELDGTLTITLADETVESFTVTNGRGISSIGYVESVGLNDYYEITYNDGSEPDTFIVHNGEKGDTGDNWYVHIKWAAVMPTQDSDMVNVPNDFIGIYAGVSETAPTSYGAYEWYEYKGEKGDTGTGITGVILESSTGLVDTYRVSFDDGTSTTFNVTNGSQINSITKTATTGLVDTYTVTLTNGLQTSFQVNNGKSIVSVSWTSTTSSTGVPHVPGATDTYTIAYNDGDATTFQIYNGLDGEGASLTVDGIPSVNADVPLLTIDTEHGAPTAQTVGSPKSRYFDAINSVLYICLGYDEAIGYLWRGAGVTVDAAMSTTSTNPVQNRIITNKIGTAALDTTAQNLSEAVNEILDDISGFADNLADDYDATATYAVGDLCIYDNVLYRCNTAISTPEAWNSIHWTETSVAEELDTISNDLGSLDGTVSGISSTIGNTPLPTTAQTLTGAISELDNAKASQSDLDDLEDDVGTLVRPNLLDNWYFVGGGSQLGGGQFPINQRGQTAYSGGSYWFDRWKGSSSGISCAINQDYISITNSNVTWDRIAQPIKNVASLTLTLSVLAKGGTDARISLWKTSSNTGIGTYVVDGTLSDWTLIQMTATVPSDEPNIEVRIQPTNTGTATLQIKAVKLEIGKTQTLAHQENGVWVLNELPNYEEQLIRCKTSTADSSDTYANKVVDYTVPNLRFAVFSPSSLTTADTFTLPSGSRHILFTIDSSEGRQTMSMLWATGNGTAYFNNMISAADITFSKSGSKVTVSHPSGQLRYFDIAIYSEPLSMS